MKLKSFIEASKHEIFHVFGGYLKDIPLPHKRRFPSKEEKRQVYVSISKFYGIGIHYHVSLREEDNPILDTSKEKPIWREAWDDEEGKGKHFFDKFKTDAEMEDFIKKTQKKEFPKKTHRLSFSDTVQKRWFYRDGD